jgi:hypothetical protein
MNFSFFLDFVAKVRKLVPVLGFRDARILAGTGRRMRFFCIAAKAYPYIELLPPTMCGLAELKSTVGLSCNGIRTCLASGKQLLEWRCYRVRSDYG